MIMALEQEKRSEREGRYNCERAVRAASPEAAETVIGFLKTHVLKSVCITHTTYNFYRILP
jgi:hypothetical protein